MSDRPPGDFGGKLREARERRGLSLREIAKATKIGITALEALERNDISRLPGGIFIRAFVKSYAIEVGLDPEKTVEEFIAQFPTPAVAGSHAITNEAEDHQAIDSDRRAATTFVWLTAIAAPIACALLYFGVAGRGTSHRTPLAPTPAEAQPVATVGTPPPPAEVVAAPAEATPAPEEVVRAVDTPPAPIETPPVAPTPRSETVQASAPPREATDAAAERLAVGVSAIGECWISVTVDGEKKVERLMQPGERLALDVRRDLVLTAGDASALTWTLNGEDAKPLGKAGKVVTARLNLTNFRDYVASR
jgi:cytoskeletal protein RodZ